MSPMRVCECVCILSIYDPRSDRSESSDHIYHKIHVEKHSSANSRKNFHGRKKIVTTRVQYPEGKSWITIDSARVYHGRRASVGLA